MDDPHPPAPMGVGERLIRVFTAPRELFSSLAGRPFVFLHWGLPFAIQVLCGVVMALVLFSNPTFVATAMAQQEKSIAKQLAQKRLTEERAAAARQAMESMGPSLLRGVAVVGAVLNAVVSPLWWALVVWAVCRAALRHEVPYLKALEITGLASLVNSLGIIVSLLLVLGTGGPIAGPHLGSFLTEFDPTQRLHLALGAANPFSIWHLVLIALGAACLVGRPFRMVLAVFGVLWLGYKVLAVVFGLPQFAL